ncbi:hypothetical protein HB780_10365 (plasmid) [Rhizobium lusitanum]|uniref:hypothetical protein n=1 Tax=Rhizobium lusitanum TaxID=293958 RepID=UPI00161B4FCC|nr:hypothetical protein [Rhizobium lusitanum]QND46077.1 hypothetical protein HB780_10365 [Rhizobium lusitanum]
MVAVDEDGTLHLNRDDISDDRLVLILVESASDDHLAERQRDGISYTFAGKNEFDLEADCHPPVKIMPTIHRGECPTQEKTSRYQSGRKYNTASRISMASFAHRSSYEQKSAELAGRLWRPARSAFKPMLRR